MIEITHKEPSTAAPPAARTRPATFLELAAGVTHETGIELSELRGPSRHGRVVDARRVLVALCRGHTILSYPEITREIKGRGGPGSGLSHTTALQQVGVFAREVARLGPIAWAIEGRLGLEQGRALRVAAEYLKTNRASRRGAEAQRERQGHG